MRSESVYYSYSAAQWLLVFYLYCMLGWCFESTVVSVGQRRLVNRGFLRGPMLPIYGFGAVILLHVSLPLKQHPVWLYLASMIAATVFEYIVGVVMEKIFKVKYWDYSKQRFQFQGYICLRSSLCWGFLGLILTSVIHPPIEKLVLGLPFIGLIVIDVLFSAAFISDVIVSVRSALDLAKVLEELDRLREQGAELRQQLSETALVGLTNLSYRVEEAHGEFTEKVGEAKAQLAERVDDAREQLADAKAQLSEKMDDAKEQLAAVHDRCAPTSAGRRPKLHASSCRAKLDELQRRFDERASRLSRTRRSLLRGNPTARSAQYDAVLQKAEKASRALKPRKPDVKNYTKCTK